MPKLKHLHAVMATIHVALEYENDKLEQIATVSAQIREAARKMPGYRSIKVSLGKVPAPVATGGVAEPPEPDLTPPPFLQRK